MKTPKVVTGYNWPQILAYLAIFLVGLVLAFAAGYYKSETDVRDVLGNEQYDVLEKLKVQEKEVKGLKKEHLKALHDLEIEQRSSTLVKQQFANLQQEIDRLRASLALYESVVQPSSKASGVYVKKLRLIESQKPAKNGAARYEIRVILAQKTKQRSYTRGDFDITFSTIDEKAKEKTHYALDKRNKNWKAKKYKFRYYQEFYGWIKVPEKAQISQLKLTIRHKSKKYDDIVVDMDWTTLKEKDYVGK